MHEQGIPVALEPATRAGRAEAATGPPRLEGVRLFASSDGCQMLVGRSGRDNHRLTFKLATPEDFWFHAQGCRGAHAPGTARLKATTLPTCSGHGANTSAGPGARRREPSCSNASKRFGSSRECRQSPDTSRDDQKKVRNGQFRVNYVLFSAISGPIRVMLVSNSLTPQAGSPRFAVGLPSGSRKYRSTRRSSSNSWVGSL